MAQVILEFYGIPRQRAGRAELSVQAVTVQDALDAAERECPGLEGISRQEEWRRHYRLSLDGRRFLTDPKEVLPAGARLLLLSADAGG